MVLRYEQGAGREREEKSLHRPIIRAELSDREDNGRVFWRVQEDEGVEQGLIRGEVAFDGRGWREKKRRERQCG